MSRRTLQDWVRWWDAGPGRGRLLQAAWVLGVLLLVLTVCHKQFHGARDEATLEQLAAARGWAGGHGHSTQALHPQALATLELRGIDTASGWVPELYQAPGYAWTVGLVLRALPGGLRAEVLAKIFAPPEGFLGDYVVLGLNAILVLGACALVRSLGRAVCSPEVGRHAGWVVLVSAGLWASAVGLSGVGLGCLLVVLAACAAWHLCEPTLPDRSAVFSALLLGLSLGALSLVDYPWLAAIPGVVGWMLLLDRRRWWLAAIIGFAAIAPCALWAVRNAALTGHVFGLSGQDLFLRVGDGAADPASWRGAWTTQDPIAQWPKVANKVLTHLKEIAGGGLWSGGFLAAALAVVGLTFRFSDERVNRLRYFSLGLLVPVVVLQGAWAAGEITRPALLAGLPLVALWGAAFLDVLVRSREEWAARTAIVSILFMGLQALPLVHDLTEPRRIHFSYPPYYPELLRTLGDEVSARGGGGWAWMSDIPAGAAWYSGRAVVGKAATGTDFREVTRRRPLLCLLLSPQTLDRPYFSELLRSEGPALGRMWQWQDIHRALVSGRFPEEFPLTHVERLAPNLIVLADPAARRNPGSSR